MTDLLAEERLLSESLATGVGGEQRRVQAALLADTHRALRAVDAGWEPFEPSPEWSWGYVDDPRLLKGRELLASWLLALPLAALGWWLLSLRWEALPAALGGLVLAIGLPVAIHGLLARPREDRHVFNAPMPAHALVAYRRARESGFFDTFVVHSPRPADFRVVAASEAPSLGLLDPVLAGRIGRHSFLIAQWDLGRALM